MQTVWLNTRTALRMKPAIYAAQLGMPSTHGLQRWLLNRQVTANHSQDPQVPSLH